VPAGLLGTDRVVTLPHVAASTRETRHAMEQLVLDNLAAFFTTGKVLTPPA
jgi:lactate dehydrogenase-like 2-hydroxyacid dehydrogenase